MIHHVYLLETGILPVLCKGIVHFLIGRHQWKGNCWCKLFPPVNINTTAFLTHTFIFLLGVNLDVNCAMQKVKTVFICKML